MSTATLLSEVAGWRARLRSAVIVDVFAFSGQHIRDDDRGVEVQAQTDGDVCGPFQYALSTRAGAEALARLRRDARLASLIPFVRQFYGRESTYIFYDYPGVAGATSSPSKGGKGSKGKVAGKGHPSVKKRVRKRDPDTGKCIRSQKRSHKAQQKRDLRKRLHQLTSQQQELNNTRAAPEQQAQATNAALTVAQSAVSQLTATTQSTTSAEPKRRPLNPKLVKAPESFTGSDSDWERFKFGFTSWIGTVDPEYPDLLKLAAAQTDEINPEEMISVAKGLCTDLFAILVGLCQSGEIPAMAMLVPDRNGFELWRRMHARFEPENKHKPYAWLRALSNPVFPNKESQWQRGLEEWEGEIAKYEREYRKTFDEDLKLAILSEVAPKTLAPQIAMHSAHLTTYKTLREFIVQYLKSKNLWKRGDGKGKDKGKADAGNANATKGPPCAICGPDKGKNHTTEACYFNARSFPKGDGKGKRTSTPGSTNVSAVEGTASDNGELTSTIAALQQQLAALRLTGASSVSASSTSSANVGRKGHTTQGAISQEEQPMLFAVAEAEVAEAVCSTMHGDGGQKYILVDSGATTSCANAKHFPNAEIDASKRKQLWAINGTPIQQQGELAAHTTLSATTADGEDIKIPARFRLDATDITEPVMAFCRILDDADCDMHFYRSSSGKPAHIQTPDNHTIVLPRFGSRFYMPFEDRTSSAARPAFVAAQRHEDDASAAPAEESAPEDGSIDVDLDGQPASPQPRHLPAPAAPTDDERALHNLTHADFAPWCRHCITGAATGAGTAIT
ncbi:hypothetical protein AK812_SmicGene43080 [Symbiodinium microadriaticum]|uniref:Uncharacterized protein n=1 Tax=Symbiodinium microadriaticum TaxID=2951 RepID=A0A1Q9C1X0_SYMMI|nr:hypothetical protein AK812_SmicGene43080 [Symbiodinium microadriaticum]